MEVHIIFTRHPTLCREFVVSSGYPRSVPFSYEEYMSRKAVIIRYAIVILVFLAFAAGLVIFFNSREPVTYEPPMKPVEVASPELHTISSYAENTSYMMAEAMIPVVPFVQGTIESYSIRPGDAVSEGDVIAVIDKRPYELQLAQAKAQATALESALSRMEPLYQAGAVTQQDYEMTKAQKDAADAQLELAELQLSYAEVTAPKGGTVVMADSSEGSVASSEMPLAIIADLSRLVVDVPVGEKFYDDIALADPESLSVEVYRPDGTLSSSASILSVSPYIDPTSKTFKVRVLLDEPAGFTIGMLVKARIVYDSSDEWSLPVSARLADGSAYALSADGSRAELVTLEGGISDSSFFSVGEANKDRMFIVKGQNSVVSGEPVTVVAGDSV